MRMLNQTGRSNAKGLGQQEYGSQSWLTLAAFSPGNKRAIDLRTERQLFLRQTGALALLLQGLAEGFGDLFSILAHGS